MAVLKKSLGSVRDLISAFETSNSNENSYKRDISIRELKSCPIPGKVSNVRHIFEEKIKQKDEFDVVLRPKQFRYEVPLCYLNSESGKRLFKTHSVGAVDQVGVLHRSKFNRPKSISNFNLNAYISHRSEGCLYNSRIDFIHSMSHTDDSPGKDHETPKQLVDSIYEGNDFNISF